MKGVKSARVVVEKDLITSKFHFELKSSNSEIEASGLDIIKSYRVEGNAELAATPILDVKNNQVRLAFAFTAFDIRAAELGTFGVPDRFNAALQTLVRRYLTKINEF